MSEKLLSVAVPTYNMEAYLRRCLDSVTRDDVPPSLELIVVNDGSTDNSLAIMQEYAEKRRDIVKIIDKSNGHYGSCVNAALKVATGKYFRILDADDWYDTDGLIDLLKGLENTSSDIVVTPYKKIRRTRVIEYKPKNVLYNHTYDLINSKIWESQDFELFAMHSIAFKTSILRKIDLHLSEGICYTDLEFLIYPTNIATSISFLEPMLYNYNMTRDGQSMDLEVRSRNSHHLVTIINRFLPLSTDFNDFSLHFCARLLGTYYYQMLFGYINDDELKTIDESVKEKNQKLYKIANRNLMFTPFIWSLFKVHFLFYERLKQKFNIDR